MCCTFSCCCTSTVGANVQIEALDVVLDEAIEPGDAEDELDGAEVELGGVEGDEDAESEEDAELVKDGKTNEEPVTVEETEVLEIIKHDEELAI